MFFAHIGRVVVALIQWSKKETFRPETGPGFSQYDQKERFVSHRQEKLFCLFRGGKLLFFLSTVVTKWLYLIRGVMDRLTN